MRPPSSRPLPLRPSVPTHPTASPLDPQAALSWPLLASSHTVAHLSGPCFAAVSPAARRARSAGCDPRPSSRGAWGALGAIATQLTGAPLPAPLLTLPCHPPAPRPPRSGKPRPPAAPGHQRRKGARKRSGSPGSAAARRGGERRPLARSGPGSRTRSRRPSAPPPHLTAPTRDAFRSAAK